jgi:predicted glycoside hydrolase/deacetylase ChbG (UPF0249 family)
MMDLMRKVIKAFITSLITIFIIPCITSSEEIKLVVRGDDMGMTQGSLVAFEKAFNEGVLTCGSILVYGPWFEGAAELYRRNPKWCVGVHLGVIGEWRGYRWRPVLPWNKVSSLVDEDGFFYRFPGELWSKKPRIEEIEAELRAQINLALKKSIQVQYLDMHYMGSLTFPGLQGVIKKLAIDYDLLVSGWMGEKRLKGIYTTPIEEKKTTALKILQDLTRGLWLWVSHPGIDSPEQNALVHTRTEDFPLAGGVGKHRAEETKVLTSDEVKSVILRKGIKLTNYKELWEEKKRIGN